MEQAEITIFFIYNPVAGKSVMKRKLPEIKRLCEERNVKGLFYGTKKKGDAKEAAYKIAKRYGVKDSYGKKYYIISAGGDGTLNETVRGVLESGCDIPVGIIPSGSTNDFGYSLGITGDIVSCARTMIDAAVSGRVFKCDVPMMNGEHYVYTSSFGLFSDVSYATPGKMKNILGHSAYLIYGALNLWKTRKIRTTVEYDGNMFEADLLLGMIVNSRSVGGFRGITGKKVRLDDGYNEMFIVFWPKGIINLAKTISLAIALKNGSQKALEKAGDMSDLSGIKIVKVKEACFGFKKKVPFSIDGEYGDMHDLVTFAVGGKRIGYLIGNV